MCEAVLHSGQYSTLAVVLLVITDCCYCMKAIAITHVQGHFLPFHHPLQFLIETLILLNDNPHFHLSFYLSLNNILMLFNSLTPILSALFFFPVHFFTFLKLIFNWTHLQYSFFCITFSNLHYFLT
ncbi:hypothetical protein FKM82_023620 [Ascaphus truei]